MSRDREPRAGGSGQALYETSGRLATWPALLLWVAFGLAVAAGACRPIDPNEDTRIEAEIKAHLVAEQNANLTRLGVLSRGGIVYLTGTVTSLDEKARAEVVSRSVRGVERVVNTLEVRTQ